MMRLVSSPNRKEAERMAKRRSSSARKGKYRSAITGRYVSAYYGKRHPKTTVRVKK
jgi:hypothetical protein